MPRSGFRLNELSGRNTPRRIFAVVAGPEQTDDIAGRVSEAGLPPEPTLVGGKLSELVPRGTKTIDLRVQMLALEVHDHTGIAGWVVYRMKRES